MIAFLEEESRNYASCSANDAAFILNLQFASDEDKLVKPRTIRVSTFLEATTGLYYGGDGLYMMGKLYLNI